MRSATRLGLMEGVSWRLARGGLVLGGAAILLVVVLLHKIGLFKIYLKLPSVRCAAQLDCTRRIAMFVIANANKVMAIIASVV